MSEKTVTTKSFEQQTYDEGFSDGLDEAINIIADRQGLWRPEVQRGELHGGRICACDTLIASIKARKGAS